jgi:hypothetical protein
MSTPLYYDFNPLSEYALLMAKAFLETVRKAEKGAEKGGAPECLWSG